MITQKIQFELFFIGMVLEFLKYKPQHNKINITLKILRFLQMMY